MGSCKSTVSNAATPIGVAVSGPLTNEIGAQAIYCKLIRNMVVNSDSQKSPRNRDKAHSTLVNLRAINAIAGQPTKPAVDKPAQYSLDRPFVVKRRSTANIHGSTRKHRILINDQCRTDMHARHAKSRNASRSMISRLCTNAEFIDCNPHSRLLLNEGVTRTKSVNFGRESIQVLGQRSSDPRSIRRSTSAIRDRDMIPKLDKPAINTLLFSQNTNQIDVDHLLVTRSGASRPGIKCDKIEIPLNDTQLSPTKPFIKVNSMKISIDLSNTCSKVKASSKKCSNFTIMSSMKLISDTNSDRDIHEKKKICSSEHEIKSVKVPSRSREPLGYFPQVIKSRKRAISDLQKFKNGFRFNSTISTHSRPVASLFINEKFICAKY